MVPRRQVNRLKERPIFDIVSVLGQVSNAVKTFTINELRDTLRQDPRGAPLQNGSVEIGNPKANQQRSQTMAQLGNPLSSANVSVQKIGKLADDADAFVNGDAIAQIDDLLRETRGLVASLTRLTNGLDRTPTKLLFGDRHKGYTPK